MLSLKEIGDFTLNSLPLCICLCTVHKVSRVQNHWPDTCTYICWLSKSNMISVHTFERLLTLWLLMHWLWVITFDMLFIKFIQTTHLTLNGRMVTELNSVLYFQMSWKAPKTAELLMGKKRWHKTSAYRDSCVTMLQCISWTQNLYQEWEEAHIVKRNKFFIKGINSCHVYLIKSKHNLKVDVTKLFES